MKIEKTLKINFINFWPGFNPETSTITAILRNHFSEVIICEDADYVITSVYGGYSYLEYPQVRIMYSGENYIPDLNFVDYAYSSYPLQMLDRHFHFPQGLHRKNKNEYMAKRSRGDVTFDRDFLASKSVFANFCASHESEHGIRGSFFQELCKYKKVDSIGYFLNNTGITVDWKNDSKYNYQKKCKFTLCFESTSHGGFNTEKIVDAFCADTIPIYFGDPKITDIYNPKAFINVADYASTAEAIQAIIDIDEDDDLYLSMMNEPILLDPDMPQRIHKEFEEWIIHIFSQPYETSFRRSRVYYSADYENKIKRVVQHEKQFAPLNHFKKKWKYYIFQLMQKYKIGQILLDKHNANKMKRS